MGERKVMGLFNRSPRPKWRELTGAMRSFTVARDFQKLAKKNTESRSKSGRSTTNSTSRGSKSTSWMTCDEDDDDDDFAELSDFEIDEDECEKPRFSDTFSSCLSTETLPKKEPKDWVEDSVPFLSFNSAIKSTPLEKEPKVEMSSEIMSFKHGVFASSTPKSNKIKSLDAWHESESKLALELEGNILPIHPTNPVLDLKADLFDSSHEEVEIPEILMSGEKEIPFNKSKSPNTQSRLNQTIRNSSQANTLILNDASEHSLHNISLGDFEKSPKCGLEAHSLNASPEGILSIPGSIIYDEKGEPFNISDLLHPPTHLNETVCSKMREREPHAESLKPDLNNPKNITSVEKDGLLRNSIFSVNSGRLNETPPVASDSSSFNIALEPVDEKGQNMQNISISVLSKLPKLGRKVAFRRNNTKKPTVLPKKIVTASNEYDLRNIPVCCLVKPQLWAIEEHSVGIKKYS